MRTSESRTAMAPTVGRCYGNRCQYGQATPSFLTTKRGLWALPDSNRRPAGCKPAALPTELNALILPRYNCTFTTVPSTAGFVVIHNLFLTLDKVYWLAGLAL